MLALRLVRTSRPSALARRALVACAAGAVGFLLLSALGHAVAHPERPGAAAVRLLWCVVPLAACAHLAVAAVRSDPGVRPRAGLDAVGVGPARLPLLAALTTGLYCALGCALALPVFLHLRGGLDGVLGRTLGGTPGGALERVPLAGAAGELLGAGHPLPRAAALTLLAVPPLAAAGASAVATRMRAAPRDHRTEPPAVLPHRPPPVPAGLPWGVAVTAAGLALETYAAERFTASAGPRVPLPGPPEALGPGIVAGWLLIAAGLVLAGPGLVHLCGLLLTAGRPGVLRLLSGRVLREEAPRVGHPAGVLCAVPPPCGWHSGWRSGRPSRSARPAAAGGRAAGTTWRTWRGGPGCAPTVRAGSRAPSATPIWTARCADCSRPGCTTRPSGRRTRSRSPRSWPRRCARTYGRTAPCGCRTCSATWSP